MLDNVLHSCAHAGAFALGLVVIGLIAVGLARLLRHLEKSADEKERPTFVVLHWTALALLVVDCGVLGYFAGRAAMHTIGLVA